MASLAGILAKTVDRLPCKIKGWCILVYAGLPVFDMLRITRNREPGGSDGPWDRDPTRRNFHP